MSEILHKMIACTTQQLRKSQFAVDYLKIRGIKRQTATKWEIGYLSSDQELLKLDGDREDLYQKGILLRRIDKSPLDQYIVFPMYDQYQDLIAVSGRPPLPNDVVKERKLRKYWHSIFPKKKFLFGINHAVEPIRKNNFAIVCEGQFDTIIPSQEGIENIVSTCGTALTEDHIILLSRYTDKVYVVFDNDDAGKKAFEQLDKYAKRDVELIPVFLPDSISPSGEIVKEDPDSFVRKYGKDKFLNILLESKSE